MKATFDRGLMRLTKETIESREADINRMRKSMLNMVISPKVGDVIEITGYAYRGKRMRVFRIGFTRWGENICAFGYVLKGNGEEGKRVGEEELI